MTIKKANVLAFSFSLHLHQQDIHSQSGRGAHEDDGLARLDYHVV